MSGALSIAQKLGLVPLTPEQEKERRCEDINNRISNLLRDNELPRWAYLETEFREYRRKLQELLKEKQSISGCK